MVQSNNIFDLKVDGETRDPDVEKNCTAWDTLIAEKFHHGRFENIYNWLSPEYVWHGPGGWLSKASDDFIDLIKEARKGVPDIRFTNQLIGSGNMVANLWSVTGTHKGDYIGIPATGNRIAYAGIALGRFDNGRLIEEWELWDTLALAQSLGVTDSSGGDAYLFDVLQKKSKDALVKHQPYNFMQDTSYSSPCGLLYPTSAASVNNLSAQVALNISSWTTYIKSLFGGDVFVEGDLSVSNKQPESHDLRIDADTGDNRFAGWPVDVMRTIFPDLQCTARSFGEGDYVACHIAWEGTHTGELEKVPATGHKVCFTSISIAKFNADNQLEHHWDVIEDITLLQQIGVSVKDKTQNLLKVFN